MTDLDDGVDLAAGPDGRVSTSAVAKAVVGAALAVVDPDAAARSAAVREWRKDYLAPYRDLVVAGTRTGDAADAVARTGLAALHDLSRGKAWRTPTLFAVYLALVVMLITVFPFETEAEVLGKANDSEFGLASYLFTRDLDRAMRIGRHIEAGMIGINTGLISTAVAPFGGVKSSGYGREGSIHGIDEYVDVKQVTMALK